MTIVCDIDNVVNNLMEKTLELYNSRFKKNLKMSDLTSFSFQDCLSEEDSNNMLTLFKEKKLWNTLSPIAGASNGLKTLVRLGHRLFFATATNPENFAWKVEWMGKHFPFICADNIMRVVDKSLLKCDIIIDDHIDNLVGNTAHRICLDYPWNRDENKDFIYDIYRTHNWREIVSAVNEIERKDAEWEK